jgi:hypothetical protein
MAGFKFFCPQCGQQIQCDTGYSGTQINCPACKQAIVVPQAPRSTAVPPAPAVRPPVPTKSRPLRNILVIAASVVVLAGLITAGWFGYSKYKRGHLPPGLVGLWSGEGGGNDSVGGNKATLTDISFAEGKVGRAFSFNGTSSSIKIAASSGLNVGTGNGFTLIAWINPANAAVANPIFEWNPDDGVDMGVQFNLFPNGQIYANIVDTSGNLIPGHRFWTATGVVTYNEFQHLALTYDKTSGLATMFRNGVLVAQQNLGVFTPLTSCNLYLGYYPLSAPWGTATFTGEIDELSLYNRALSADEIKAVAVEENHGEPLPEPKPAPFPQRTRSF